MLHEILLALSGHPSPLLQNQAQNSTGSLILSPQERALLKSIGHLSDLHCKLIAATKAIPAVQRSSICQAVATSIRSVHLNRFRARILEVEKSILRKDTDIVGAYDVVPLTMIVDSFSGWTRRMEWLLDICEFIQDRCSGSQLIDHLRGAIQTGYSDIEEAALQLAQVAESAWLKQVSGWLLYGRLPPFGGEDFFIQQDDFGDKPEYETRKALLPEFVTKQTASSILFIGTSLNQVRDKGVASSQTSLTMIPAHLKLLSSLSFPIKPSSLESVVAAIRLSLSQNALQQLLPMSRIEEMLNLLHEFFLLGRGEFAVALITEADEKIRSRWRRTDHGAYEKRDRFNDVMVKEGEVKAVLNRTWASMAAMQNALEDNEEQFDMARDLVQLSLSKSSSTPSKPTPGSSSKARLATTPFNNLLLSIPTTLTLHIPSPLDLFLTQKDVSVYSHINAYLLSIRRAHLRLADLWKVTSLRRSHPAPPAPPFGSSPSGRAMIKKKRSRETERTKTLRGVWASSSAALFLLGETEAYFYGEVVQGTWQGFQEWLTGRPKSSSRPATSRSNKEGDDEDIWAAAGKRAPEDVKNTSYHTHDPQTLANAHRMFLAALTTHLLLAIPRYTDSLYMLLQQVDYLVSLVYRIQTIWSSLDLEEDDGVVDAFIDFRKEKDDVEQQLFDASKQVKRAIETVVDSLRSVDPEKDGLDSGSLDDMGFAEGHYVPRKVGRVDRLLMKLDFGGWFDKTKAVVHDDDSDRNDFEL